MHDKHKLSPKQSDEIVKKFGVKKEHLHIGKEKLAMRDIILATGVTKEEASLKAVRAFRAHAGIDQTENQFARHKEKVKLILWRIKSTNHFCFPLRCVRIKCRGDHIVIKF